MARTAKNKVAQDVELKMAEPAAANVEPMDNPSMLKIALDVMRSLVPANWKRVCCAIALGVAASVASTVVIVQVVEVLAMAALTAGSGFLAALIFVFGLLLCVYAALKTTEIVTNYVFTGQIDRDIISAKDKVLGFFKRSHVTAA